MVSLIFWVSLYFMIVSYILLFFSCASYYEIPCIYTYNNEIGSFYDSFIARMESQGNNISKIFFSNTCVGSCYRHFLVKEYIEDTNKLKELDFSESEIESINKLIVPGFEERNSIFNILRFNLVFVAIILGVIVGSLV